MYCGPCGSARSGRLRVIRGPCEPAARASAVAPFHVMRILERAKAREAAGHDVIHMEVGEPDFPTPDPILEAAQEALGSHAMGYTPAAGLPQLRAAIADYYRQRYGTDLDPERVIVTPGGSGALLLALAAVVDVSQVVLTTDPGYPCNRHMVSLLGGVPRSVPVLAEQHYRLTLGAISAHWEPNVRAVMVASPANPTGTVLSREDIAELRAFAQARDAALIVDEIYQGLTYGVADHSAVASGDENVFVVNSFSKYFCMTGWRLGWLVAPARFIGTLTRLAQNLFLAAPTLAQYAALVAFLPDTLKILNRRRDQLRERRDTLVEALGPLGFAIPSHPEGAFYVYARIPERERNSSALAERLLEDADVAVTPGLDFGIQQADRMLRFAYTTESARLMEAARRIESVIGRA
jgi:aspartate/methionine/tyrosine aminotransferase